MVYKIRILPRAERDLDDIFTRIRAPLSEPAAQWFQGLIDAAHSLSVNPHRCPLTPEDPGFRHLLYGRAHDVYRVIFRILPKRVVISHIRHGARKPFTPADLN